VFQIVCIEGFAQNHVAVATQELKTMRSSITRTGFIVVGGDCSHD